MARTARTPVPAAIVARLRAVCRALPGTREEAAWVGVRWRVGRETFAHVLIIEDGWPPAYAKAAGLAGPACVLTFRSVDRLFQPERFDRPPFFRPPWFANIVGLVLEDAADSDDVAALVRDSWRVQAPRTLVSRTADGWPTTPSAGRPAGATRSARDG